MDIRAILLDMDGTMLGRSQVAVSRRNMHAIQRAMEKGIHVIPCTGRVFDMMPPQFLTQEGVRYYITSHGARVVDRTTDKPLYTDVIPPDESAELLSLLEGRGLYNEIAANATIYLEQSVVNQLSCAPVPEHHLWYIRDICYTAVERPSEYFRSHGIGVEKMNIYAIPEHLQREIYDGVTATGYISHTRPGIGANLEFSHAGLDKLRAVDAVLDRLGISYSQVMALGDSSSDLEIIRRSGLGIAMGNAPERIKAQADDVTLANDEDGVALAVEKYLL